MTLAIYRAKRNFRRTPEPGGGKRTARAAGASFVVQKHAARQLHYDFRLEHDGVLWSWAIPKGPSLDPADKRLAVRVEDHPLEYAGFEGVIPEGEYGGGTVMVWDRGTWTPHGDPAQGYAKGRLGFTLDGEKLRGGFALVRTRGGRYGGSAGGKEAWLLIKEDDTDARHGNGAIVDDAPDSVVSGRSLDRIARARSHVWRSKLSAKANVEAGAVAASARKRARGAGATAGAGTRMPMPATLAPMLASLAAQAPAGDEWIHEIKYDGYRMLARIERGRVRLLSRNGKDWTKALPSVARDVARLPVAKAWIDGEAVVVDAEGRTSFQALQNALTGDSRGLAFFAFDLLYRDGYDLRRTPLAERKRQLREIVGAGAGTVRLGPETQGGGEDFHRQACALHLEGSVAKQASSTYATGRRSRDWLKVKCLQRQEMVVGGYTDPQRSRTGFGALLLGVYEHGRLRYAGKVGTGFDEKLLRELAPKLARLVRKTPAFVDPPRGFAAKGAHWIRPELVAEVAFTEWSKDGALRHPSFQGLRLDKKAAEVVREQPLAKAPPSRPSGGGRKLAGPARRGARGAASGTPDRSGKTGPTLSHPDKVYFPEAGITKRDLAEYYVALAPRMLPHLEGRPLTLVRCPDGWRKQCFYQRNAERSVHEAVARIAVPDGKSGTATYLTADSAAALACLVQWGAIELHPWGSRAPRLDRPDRLVFDFDPDAAVAWRDLVAAVMLLRTLLGELGLVGFLKTTGGKGLHVVVPIRPTLTWEEARSFARAVTELIAKTFPDRVIAAAAKERRKGKIFLDYLRNAAAATAVVAYGVRARENAPVAMPIDWVELDRDVRFAHFNLRNAAQRLERLERDPWAAFFTTRQSVTAAMRKRFA